MHVESSDLLPALRAKVGKKLGDLKAHEEVRFFSNGRELRPNLSLREQSVRPNSVLQLLRSRVHPWPHASLRLPGDSQPRRPPGAFKKKSELSVADGHVVLLEYCEERPLLLSNPGMGARLATYYRKQSSIDAGAAALLKEQPFSGVAVPLEPGEESPFLGDITAGQSQSSLETNLFRAPLFRHAVGPCDFLLVRSPKGKLSVRRVNCLSVVGQQEPHVEVLAPGSKAVQQQNGDRVFADVCRAFRSQQNSEGEKGDKGAGGGGSKSDKGRSRGGGSRALPRVSADELAASFPSLSEAFLRKRLRSCAELQRGPGSDGGTQMWWVMKDGFHVPSEEELRRLVTPEKICANESMLAAMHQLKRSGIHTLTSAAGTSPHATITKRSALPCFCPPLSVLDTVCTQHRTQPPGFHRSFAQHTAHLAPPFIPTSHLSTLLKSHFPAPFVCLPCTWPVLAVLCGVQASGPRLC